MATITPEAYRKLTVIIQLHFFTRKARGRSRSNRQVLARAKIAGEHDPCFASN